MLFLPKKRLFFAKNDHFRRRSHHIIPKMIIFDHERVIFERKMTIFDKEQVILHQK